MEWRQDRLRRYAAAGKKEEEEEEQGRYLLLRKDSPNIFQEQNHILQMIYKKDKKNVK